MQLALQIKLDLQNALRGVNQFSSAIDGMGNSVAKITGSGDGDAHLKMVEWAERSQSKCILGQTLSAEAQATGMGSGVADLHNAVRHDILKSDARKLASTLTRDLVYPLLAINGRGGDTLRNCPRWVFDLGDAEDIKNFAQHLPPLAANGMKIGVAWVHEKLRLPIAEAGEAVFGGTDTANVATPQQANEASGGVSLTAQPSAGTREMAAAAPGGDISAIDRLETAAAPVMEDWLKKIEAMLEAADSLEEFRAMLLAAYGRLDTGAMAESLAVAMAARHLAGRSEIMDEGKN